jgi:two-component system, NarL family, sensor histidine kinase UhpB
MRLLRRLGIGISIALAMTADVASLLPAGAAAAERDPPGRTTLIFRAERDVALHETIDMVCCTGAYPFEPPGVEQLTLGFGEDAAWLRITLAAEAGVLQLTAMLDEVTMYARLRDGRWKAVRTGDQLPVDVRELHSPFMALPVPGDIADPNVFVRVVQPTAVALSVVQWELPVFLAMQAADQVIKTFLFGFICAMLLFNSIVWVLVRDPVFLLNACTIAGLLLVALYLSGYGAAYFWASLPGWSNRFYVIGLVVALVGGGAFMWRFIRLPGEPHRRGWPLLGPGLSAALAGLAALFLPHYIVNPWLLLSAAAILVAGTVFVAVRAFRGEARARILLVPLLLAILPGSLLVALDRLLGVRPLALGNNGLEITLCLEAALFSLALTSRIRLTEKMARDAGARLLAFRGESARRVIEAQDAERRRFAAELHDGAGQSFLAVLNELKRLARSGLPAAQQTKLSALAETTAEALGDVRRISRDMHPSAIEHLGLGQAIESLVAPLPADGINIETHVDIEESRLSAEARLHIYRIIQECVANALRHARASRLAVSLTREGQQLALSIEDDGVGLAEAAGGQRQGLGFTSIGERVRMLGGQWNTGRSGIGGLAVRVIIPADQPGTVSRLRDADGEGVG